MINPRKIKNIKDIFPILSIDSSIDPKFNIIVSKNADLTIAFEVTLPELPYQVIVIMPFTILL
jgi:hypothetical protein